MQSPEVQAPLRVASPRALSFPLSVAVAVATEPAAESADAVAALLLTHHTPSPALQPVWLALPLALRSPFSEAWALALAPVPVPFLPVAEAHDDVSDRSARSPVVQLEGPDLAVQARRAHP